MKNKHVLLQWSSGEREEVWKSNFQQFYVQTTLCMLPAGLLSVCLLSPANFMTINTTTTTTTDNNDTKINNAHIVAH